MGRVLRVTIGTVSDVPASGLVTDRLGAVDSVTTDLSGVRAPADVAGVSDAVATVFAAQRSPVDAVGVGDAVAASLVTLPGASGTFPSAALFPSSTTYPGA